jgi:hypothetical protein
MRYIDSTPQRLIQNYHKIIFSRISINNHFTNIVNNFLSIMTTFKQTISWELWFRWGRHCPSNPHTPSQIPKKHQQEIQQRPRKVSSKFCHRPPPLTAMHSAHISAASWRHAPPEPSTRAAFITWTVPGRGVRRGSRGTASKRRGSGRRRGGSSRRRCCCCRRGRRTPKTPMAAAPSGCLRPCRGSAFSTWCVGSGTRSSPASPSD